MATTSQTVQKLYIAYFGRPADPAGATNAAKLVEWTGSPDALLVDFGKSAEYTSQFAGLTSAQIVNTIYNNLFGRNAEATGLNFWAAKVDSGEIPLSTATWTILSGVTAGSVDDIAVNSKVSYAESFTAKLATDAAAAVAYNASTLAMVKAELAKIVDATTLQPKRAAWIRLCPAWRRRGVGQHLGRLSRSLKMWIRLLAMLATTLSMAA